MLKPKLFNFVILLSVLLILGLGVIFTVSSQTQRNPVIEFCTGTW